MNKEQKAHIVVGVGYGDEGKGMLANYLALKAQDNTETPVVIRFSGGPQAGHTVHYAGLVHVHSSFAAGTLAGIPSYWTEHTCIYPPNMEREREVLHSQNVTVDHTVHPLARIITPFDVLANRNCEKNMKDGSCGLGIGQTREREKFGYFLNVIDLIDMKSFRDKVWAIGEYYGFKSVEDLPPMYRQEYNIFMAECAGLMFKIGDYEELEQYSTLIFEGSQGVLLDKKHGVYPHVTYANTTSKNALEVCDKIGITTPTIYHVSRAYHTRHGNGPFKEENIELDNSDETNVLNAMQGKFKVAPLDAPLLNKGILTDVCYSNFCKRILVFTCCDQIHNDFKGELSVGLKGKHEQIWYSHSPTGDKITKYNLYHSKNFRLYR